MTRMVRKTVRRKPNHTNPVLKEQPFPWVSKVIQYILVLHCFPAKNFETISAWLFAGLALTIKFKYCSIFRVGIKTLKKLKQIGLA